MTSVQVRNNVFHEANMSSSSMLFFFFLLLFLYSSSSQPSPYFDCTSVPYTCGATTITIAYPFQIDGRHDYCGHPGFFLNCTNSNTTLTITISNRAYKITNGVDYGNQHLNIVDIDFIQNSCPQPYRNTSIDPTLLQYDNDQNMSLYINCTKPSVVPNYSNIGCLLNETGKHSYFTVDNGNTTDLLGSCSSTVMIPMGQEAAEKFVNGSLGFGEALQLGFSVRWTAGMEWCSGCVSSGGYCGYSSSSPGSPTCFCSDGSTSDSCWPTSGNSPKHGKSGTRRNIIIGLCIGFASFLILSYVFVFQNRSLKISEILFQKKAKHERTIEAFLEKYGSLATKRYTYFHIKKMTKSFSEKLGQGGYGSVYKGSLFDGHPVAVKLLNETEGNGEDFINEVAAIGNTSHINIVSLRGFCVEGSKRALIYDFMPNGSLDQYIYSEKLITETFLGWEKLYEIAVGIARGLEYLHRGCNSQIVHFDIKPHNILLDQDFCPKISDFGMAKLCPPKQSTISMYGTRGTIGYIAPEIFSRTFGVVSNKSDVYSYGMMVLEMFGGKKSMNSRLESLSETYFPLWMYKLLEEVDDLMDYGVTNENEEIARKMLVVGLWCIQVMPENRPSMRKVVDMLEESVNDLPVPPKPYLSSPPLNLKVDSYTTSCSIE